MVKHFIAFLTRFIPRTTLQRVAHLGFKSVSWIYSGSRFEDPIDGATYRKMLPYGRVRSRPNALAPRTLSLERHRALWVYFQRETDFFSSTAKMLHLAPEYCFIKRFREMENIEYVSGDLDSPWADHHFDVHDIPFEDNTFDMLMANHLMEHVDDDSKVLSEFFRVMKPGAWGVLQVPINWKDPKTQEDRSITDPKERERLYWQSDHVRLYGHEDYPKLLESAGFEVEVVDMEELLGSDLYTRYCLGEERWVYAVKKPV